MITTISKTGKAHFLRAAVLLMVLFILPTGSAYADWPEVEKLLAADGAASDSFGNSVSVSGDYAIVGASQHDDNGTESGSAYIFYYDGISWSQQHKLLAADGAANDRFGTSVSVSGDYAIVGALYDDDNVDASGSAYIFKRDGTSWSQQAKLLASDGAFGDWFGRSVSISGDYAIVGATYDDDNGDASGSAYIFKRDGIIWSEQAKLTASDGAVSDYFAFSVSISGDYAVVGAHADDDNGGSSGSAYIFKRDGTSWSEQDKLTAANGAAGDYFGYSVSISGDYAIVGAFYDDYTAADSGSAYIFKRGGTNWSEQAKLLASDGAANDRFGISVSISGSYAIVGAHLDDDNGGSSGSAYLFYYDVTTWNEQAKLTASDGAFDDRFGGSVSISGDYAVVGAYWDDDNGDKSGSAYIFKGFAEIRGTKWHDTDGDGHFVEDTDEQPIEGWLIYIDINENGQFDAAEPNDLTDSEGNYFLIAPAAGTYLVAEEVRPCWEQTCPGGDGTYSVTLEAGEIAAGYNFGNARPTEIHPSGWQEDQRDKLLAADGAAGDEFGWSVSVSGDYAIVGAHGDDDSGSYSGSAYIFAVNDVNCGDWDEAAKLTAADGADSDYFGTSVSISGDYAIVGAYYDDDNGSASGSAYIFYYDGASWSQQAKLTAADGAAGDYFGWSVSISGDYAIVGASGNDDYGTDSGSAYIFKRSGTGWGQQDKLLAADGAARDVFGYSVSISGDYAIVGAYFDDDKGGDSGSAYIFYYNGTSWSEQAKLTASDGAADDWFGRSVSISGDYAIVGAYCDDDNGSLSGSAYIFKRDGTGWSEQVKLLASDAAAGDRFGWSVSVSGDYVIAGAHHDDDNGTDSGSAYIFGKGLCPSMDGTGDCLVNFEDFAIMAGQWLQGTQ